MEQHTVVKIDKTEEDGIMDCTIKIKCLPVNYYLILEDIFSLFIREKIKPIKGKTHEQRIGLQAEFSLPIEPILQLHEVLLKECQDKINPVWRLEK